MPNEKDFQNLKAELKSLKNDVRLIRECFNEQLRAQALKDAVWEPDFQAEALKTHAGARALVANGRYEIWCSRCGKLLGWGDTARVAWRAARTEPQFSCAGNPPLVDADFSVFRSGFNGSVGSVGGYVEMKQLIPAGSAPAGRPCRVNFYSDDEPLYGHQKLHVTITEVLE
jgi:hypothetical protein